MGKKKNLPTSVSFRSCDFMDAREEDLEDIFLNLLSDHYGYCINSFRFKKEGDMYKCYNIDWDTSD